jgi:hypothetical protein
MPRRNAAKPAKQKGLTAVRPFQRLDGAGKRSRTPDLRITNALLYQLSYAGTALLRCKPAILCGKRRRPAGPYQAGHCVTPGCCAPRANPHPLGRATAEDEA